LVTRQTKKRKDKNRNKPKIKNKSVDKTIFLFLIALEPPRAGIKAKIDIINYN
jgi:hypothetical protein